MILYDGLTKAEVLKALYDYSMPQGLGILQYMLTGNMGELSLDEAEDLLKETNSFDYLNGKVMKVTLGDEGFEEWLYDRDNGKGAAQHALDEYRVKKQFRSGL